MSPTTREVSKSNFWLEQISFLGHVILQQGVFIDPSKIEMIVEWPRSTRITKVRSFLGLARYYRRSVMYFFSLITPLTKLTCKDEKFVWTEDYESSFQELKIKLTSVPILTFSSGSGGFVIYSDVSLCNLGCVLM